MKLSSQRMDIRKGLIAILMVAVWVATPWLTGGQAIAKTNSKTKKSLSRQLYNVSGFNKERNYLSRRRVNASILTRPKILKSLGLSIEQIKLTNEIGRASCRERV